MRKFKRHESGDYNIQKVQDALESALKSIEADSPIIPGRLINDVALTSGTASTISHGLGRKLRGYIVVLRNANATVWDDQATNTNSTRTLILNASANVTISLWVF